MKWHSLNVPPTELRILTTLQSGQSFRWTLTQDNQQTIFTSVLQSHLICLFESSTDVFYGCPLDSSKSTIDRVREILVDYFQLKVPLEPLYKQWSLVDENFKRKCRGFPGLRILRWVYLCLLN